MPVKECVHCNIHYCLLSYSGLASVHPVVQFPKVGGSATFTCGATGVPKFTWRRYRPTQKLVSDDRRYILSSGTGSSQLTINNIPHGDQGYYVCDATVDIDQPNLATGYVQVQCK